MRVIIAIVSLLQSQPLLAQLSESKLNHFSVQGSVELKEVADQASLSFSIKGVEATLRQAVENADKKTKSLTDKLTTLGVKVRNIATSQFYSGDNLGDKAFLSSSRDYRAIITTTIKIDSLRLLQPVIFAISEAEVEELSQIFFSLKDEFAFRRRARIEAALKAKEKADDIAKALGITIGKVFAIEEMPTHVMTPPPMFGSGGNYPNPFNPGTPLSASIVDESKGSGFFAQTVTATSQIRVTFEIK